MIINEHNNTLPENKESDLTFLYNTAPHVTAMPFEFNLNKGDELVIPYRISSVGDTDWLNNQKGQTYTTIIRVDEDTKEESYVAEHLTWKKTTYSGEQVMVLDGYDFEVGQHSLSIRTIGSSGIGSATLYYRFIVRDPALRSVLDLDAVADGEGFTGELDGKDRKFAKWQYETSKKVNKVNVPVVKRITEVEAWSKTTDTYVSTKAKFEVTMRRNSDGSVKELVIVVGEGGVREYTNANNGAIYTMLIDGEYHLTTVYKDDDGEEKLLEDLLDTPADELPGNAVLIAASNKLALTMLLLAAKGTGKTELKMPEGMVWVFDHHNIDGSTTVTYNDKGRNETEFPNHFTIDFNNETFRTLQTGAISSGWFITVRGNIDTHLKNLNVRSHYKGFRFNGKTTKTSYGESLSSFNANSCQFCTFDNIDVSYSIGYCFGFSTDTALMANHEYSSKYKQYSPRFDEYGYIGYDGEAHGEQKGDGTAVQMLHTSGFNEIWDKWNGIFSIMKCSSAAFNGYIDGTNNRGISKLFFVHYYDADKNFIKTVKVYDSYPIIVPLNAAYTKLSTVGSIGGGTYTYTPNRLNRDNDLALFRTVSSMYHWANVVSNCRVHDTRSCMFVCSGIQTSVKDCKFWNIAQEGPIYQVTKHFVDIEDLGWLWYYGSMEKCEQFYGQTRTFNALYYNNISFNRLQGISLNFQEDVQDVHIKNCIIDAVTKYYGTALPMPMRIHVDASRINRLKLYARTASALRATQQSDGHVHEPIVLYHSRIECKNIEAGKENGEIITYHSANLGEL